MSLLRNPLIVVGTNWQIGDMFIEPNKKQVTEYEKNSIEINLDINVWVNCSKHRIERNMPNTGPESSYENVNTDDGYLFLFRFAGSVVDISSSILFIFY